MKIGIFTRKFLELTNWELRLIEEIINDPNLELSLLIFDGRETIKSKYLFRLKNFFGKGFLKIQLSIEEFFLKSTSNINKEHILRNLEKVDSINVYPEKKRFFDYFKSEDSDKISKYNLDVIIRREFGIIKGDIFKSAKHGIWSFHHGDNSINRGGPAGFWEMILKEKTVGVTLQQLTPELDGGNVIDKAFFNRQWSYYLTRSLILEGSVSLILKNLKKINSEPLVTKKSTTYFNPLYKSPNLYYVLIYIHRFYGFILKKIGQKILTFLFGFRFHRWTLFIGRGDFMNAYLFRIKPVKLPKNEFWADPFLIEYKNETFIFFENYSYKTKKGIISCGKIDINNNVSNVVDVLDLDYHLSYPFVFEENGDVFLMPESKSNKRLEIYRSTNFPNDWELYSTAFEGEMVGDAFFYDDKNGDKWLFINKQVANGTLMETELFIYRVDSLKLKSLEPHRQNPIYIDSSIARNGGAIFEYDDKLFRPSQSNIDGIYGKELNINYIKSLTIDKYVEEKEIVIKPNFQKNLKAIHHLHQINGIFVFDAAYRIK